MKWPTRHVSAIGNQKVIPVWNSRWCEFSHVNTLLFGYGQKSKKYTFFIFFPVLRLFIIFYYYINTNEIPSELSRENLISSHVKITCYLHVWKYHRCYGYIINRAFHTQKLLKWNGLVFHWCLYNKYNITWPISLLVMKKYLIAFTREIFFNSRREISYLRAAM